MGQILARAQLLFDIWTGQQQISGQDSDTPFPVQDTNPPDYSSYCHSNSPLFEALVIQNQRILDLAAEVDALRRENQDLLSVCRLLNAARRH